MAAASAVDVPMTDSAPADKPNDVEPQLTPPASEEAFKHSDSSSELSEPQEHGPEHIPVEDDIGDIEPDHYWDDGRIPVFKPNMRQFESFKKFINKIDKYGMKSGVVKVIPPKEWLDALPALDEAVKSIKVKNPITQEFNGTQGKYIQGNMEKQRSYTLPQWKGLTEESSHQPPAKRGERRKQQGRAPRPTAPRPSRATPSAPQAEGPVQKRKPGRPRKHPIKQSVETPEPTPVKTEEAIETIEVPPTPISPTLTASTPQPPAEVKKEKASTPSKPRGRQPKSVSSRRKNNSNEQNDVVDEEAFKDFNYRLDNLEEWTKERCQELESSYWKSLSYNNAMYGADMPGSLFEDKTTSWNVAKLENLLDVLGQKVPGVNTAYLYLGMWKATFAWHLEDVDLYSINYIHFGAPKQWYSISQEDARKFENAMKTLWPEAAKGCDQFLRHKTFLVSPQVLKSQFGITVNRLVHYEGEFVITFPYGYHSGYNLGYNCAESVNFATESWLDFGKIAKKCNCEADSVWVDVYDIERKLRGEPTPEYELEEYYDYEDDEDDDGSGDLPTPPGSDKDVGKIPRKRKGDNKDDVKPIKKLRLNGPKSPPSPCQLCPNDIEQEDLLPTKEGKQVHRLCALYIPETYVEDKEVEGGQTEEVVVGVSDVDKKRNALTCLYCRRKNSNSTSACFQCGHPKCARAYHATCAAAAGVSVEIGPEARQIDGKQYSDVGIALRCRFHRHKRPKYADTLACIQALEKNADIFEYAAGLQPKNLVQFLLHHPHREIQAGYVIENRESEGIIFLELVPRRYENYPTSDSWSEDKQLTGSSDAPSRRRRAIEVDYKYVLPPVDKVHSNLTAPLEGAPTVPAELARRTNEDPAKNNPKPGDPFTDATNPHKWAEFKVQSIARNPEQKSIELSKPRSLAFYLGKPSTEAKAQYTQDPAIPRNNPSLHFLEIVKPQALATAPAVTAHQHNIATHRTGTGTGAYPLIQQNLQQARGAIIATAAAAAAAAYRGPGQVHAPSGPQPNLSNLKLQQMPRQSNGPDGLKHERSERPYKGKYAITHEDQLLKGGRVDAQALRNQQAFLQSSQQQQHAHSVNPNFAAANYSPKTAVRPATNMHNMADIRRRQSNPPPPLNMEQVQRMQWQQQNAQQRPVSRHQLGSRPSSSQQNAPVANMMGSTSPAAQSTFSRSTTSHQTPPSTANSSIGSRSRSDSVKALAKYPYLHVAAMARPQVYRSPYGPPGIINEDYLSPSKPAMLNKMRPRGKSLTQNFLDSATPKVRGQLNGHVRTISTEKATLMAQESARRKEELQRLRANMGPPNHPLSPTFGNSFTHELFPDRNFTNSPGFGDFNSTAFNTNADFNNYFNYHQPQPSLHYSSPQAFQQQVRQEEHNMRHKPHMMSHGRNSYGALKNLNTGLANMHSHAHGGQDVVMGADGPDNNNNTQGSPIRTGRDAVSAATLPMMDPSSF